MTPIQRALRTILQLVASGALTALINSLAGGFTPAHLAEVLAGWQVVVTLAQNLLEDGGFLPPVFKVSAPIPPPTSNA